MSEVSVIMPCYNHGKFLSEAIESILGQSYEDLELIIVEDCSKDNSAEIIRKYEQIDKRIVAVYHKNNEGVSRSRNDAIARVSGNYIAFCDADDIWEKDKLSIQIDCFSKYPEYGVIHSDSIIIDESSRPTGEHFSSLYQKGMKLSGNLFEELCTRNFINTPTVIMRRKCINDAGLFEESFKYNEDWIYWVRTAQKNLFFYIPESLVRYRIHSRSTMLDGMGFTDQIIKASNFILNMFPDMPNKAKSRLFYAIGMEYRYITEKRQAREFFIRSIKADPLNLRTYFRLMFR